MLSLLPLGKNAFFFTLFLESFQSIFEGVALFNPDRGYLAPSLFNN